MILDRSEDLGPMVLFLAWSLGREHGMALDDSLARAIATITANGSLSSDDIFDGARAFAEEIYGRDYFELVRSVFRTSNPALESIEAVKLARLAERLDRLYATFAPDPDRLTVTRAIAAIHDAGSSLLARGFRWNAERRAFVRLAGASSDIRHELRPWVTPADRRRGQTGVRAGGIAAITDARVDSVVQRIVATLTTATLSAPLLETKTRSHEVPHAARMQTEAETIVAELVECESWLDGLSDERAVLDAFPIAKGSPAWTLGDAGWAYRRGLFAVASGLETVEGASQVFEQLGKRERYWRTAGARELWATCVAALRG